MVYLKYDDFGQLYHQLTRYPLTAPESEDFFTIGASQYVNNLVIETDSHNISGPSSDLGNFNYTMAKWSTLLNKYVDNQAYADLKTRLVWSTCKTLTFNFKIHVALPTDTDQTKSRDSCIIAIVFSRNGTSGKWTHVNIFWRVAEIYQKFAVDLLLLNRMFEDLPNLQLSKYALHLAQPFWSTFKLCELIDGPLFSVDEFKDSDSFLGKKMYAHYLRYYGPGAELSNFHAIRRKQEMKLSGKVNKSIPLELLKMPDTESGTVEITNIDQPKEQSTMWSEFM